MNQRKRWASKEEAKDFVYNALNKRNLGLSFWAACDYIGWSPKEVYNSIAFSNSLYEDYLLCMGEEYLDEEISIINSEIYYGSQYSTEELSTYLNIAKSIRSEVF